MHLSLISFISALIIIPTSRSSIPDNNLFDDGSVSSMDVLPNEETYGSFIADDFISDDDKSFPSEENPDGSLIQIPDDLQTTDEDLAADSCSSMVAPLGRIRARSDFCTEQNSIKDDNVDPAVETAEDVQKYWCSQYNVEGFAYVPVCNVNPSRVRKSADVLRKLGQNWNVGPEPDVDVSEAVTLFYSKLSKSLRFWSL